MSKPPKYQYTVTIKLPPFVTIPASSIREARAIVSGLTIAQLNGEAEYLTRKTIKRPDPA